MKFLEQANPAFGRKSGRLYFSIASGLLTAVLLPAAASGAKSNVALEQGESAVMTAWHDRDSRILHIGTGQSPPVPEDPVLVTISRASDLVGRPINLARPAWHNLGQRNGPSLRSRPLPTSMPLSAMTLTSGFGTRRHPFSGTRRQHNGLDLAARTGSPIVATSDGVVSKADWNGGYGLYVALDHGRGVQTRYGHMSRLNVSAGEKVRKGDVIGYVGSTGRSTGPHLHYEIRINGQAVNPARLIQH